MNESNTPGRRSGRSAEQPDGRSRTVAAKTFVKITAIIFASEAVVMVLLHMFGLRGIWDVVIDPIALALLSTPLPSPSIRLNISRCFSSGSLETIRPVRNSSKLIAPSWFLLC